MCWQTTGESGFRGSVQNEHKQHQLKFDLGSPILFSKLVTITHPSLMYKKWTHIYIYIYACISESLLCACTRCYMKVLRLWTIHMNQIKYSHFAMTPNELVWKFRQRTTLKEMVETSSDGKLFVFIVKFSKIMRCLPIRMQEINLFFLKPFF